MPPKPAEMPRNEQVERAETAPESAEQELSLELMSYDEAREELSRAAKEAESKGKEERKELDLSKKTLESVAQRYGVELDLEAANDNAAIDAKADDATKKFKNELKDILKQDVKPAQTEQDRELTAIDAGWDQIATDQKNARIDAMEKRVDAELAKDATPATATNADGDIELLSVQEQMAEMQKTADKEAATEGTLMSMQDQMEHVQRMADASVGTTEAMRRASTSERDQADKETVLEVHPEDVPESTLLEKPAAAEVPPSAPAAPEAKPDAAAMDAARLGELQTIEQSLMTEFDRLAKQVKSEAETMSAQDKKAYAKALKTGDMSGLPKASPAEGMMNDANKRLNALRAEKNALLSRMRSARTEAPAENRPMAQAESPVAETRQQSETEKMLSHLPPELSAAAMRNYDNVDERSNGGLVAKGLTPDGKVRATYADNTVLEISPDGSYSASKLKTPERSVSQAEAAKPEAGFDADAELEGLENIDLIKLEEERDADKRTLATMAGGEGIASNSSERQYVQKRLDAMNATIDKKNAPEGLTKEIAKLQDQIDANMAKMVGLPEEQEVVQLQVIEKLMTQVTELKRRQEKAKTETPPDTDPEPAGGKNPEKAEIVDDVEPMMLEDDPRYSELLGKKMRQLTAKGVPPKQAAGDAGIWAKTMFEKKFPDEATRYEAAKEKKEGRDNAPDVQQAA